ncbi:MAG: putative bifunctional diguanylate cyclase/phosphodiesterase [Leptothrix sp. (in: b-proteobacteria)]
MSDTDTTPAWKAESRLATLMGWVAGMLACIVAVGAPAGYFWLSYRAQERESAIAARLHAAFVMQVISLSRSDWRHDVEGLIEAELSPSELPERRMIRDISSTTIAISGPALATPVLTSAAPLLQADGWVGEVMVQRSLRPLLLRSALVALFTFSLGGAIFASLYVLPLRALRRTITALQREESKAREEAEEVMRIVFENAIEGILMYTPDGTVVSSNRAASKMLGFAAPELCRMRIGGLILTESTAPALSGQFEALARRHDGSTFPVDVTANETSVTGQCQYIAIVRDITERKQHELRLSRLANYDNLTGLPNRSLFRDRLQMAMARTRRTGGQLALMFLDLDRFKVINDSLGHEVGDKLLQQVARVLASCLRDTDSVSRPNAADTGVYRLGGDEFTVLIEDLPDARPAIAIAHRILDALALPIPVDSDELYISTSIGITLYPRDDNDLDGLIKQADMAMYQAKAHGRGTFEFFSPQLNAEAIERHTLEAGLRLAAQREEFAIVYQPKADMRSGHVTGVEALLRWQRPDLPPIGPDKFIPILEEIGLIVPVGTWVLRQACAQMVAWDAQGLAPLNLAVNLSARQFRQQDLVGQIARLLADTGFDPHRLEIELTESMLIDDLDYVVSIMAGLAGMGVRVAIDDFGTGHSSLSYLKRFNVDTLKIDRSFVRDTPDDADDSAISLAVIALAHGLHLKVVAEGVENEAQAEFLRSHGCDEMQGYLLSRPLAPEGFVEWLRAREPGFTRRDTRACAFP